MGTETRKSWLPVGVLVNATPSLAPAEAVGVEAAWERFRHEAAAVDPSDVKTFKQNASVVLHNVQTGVGAVMAERAWFEAQTDAPPVDFARVADAESAAEALSFAAARAATCASEPPTLAAKIKRARKLCKTFRSNAEALVATDVLAATELPSLVEGSPIEVARACVAWAAFFREKHGKVRGATGVRSALVREAAELGTELLREIKPRGVRRGRPRSEAERAAAEDRDRMAVVVERRYDYVERVACWRWGRDCEAIVPPMRTRDLFSRETVEEEDAAEEETETPPEATNSTRGGDAPDDAPVKSSDPRTEPATDEPTPRGSDGTVSPTENQRTPR